MSGTFSYREYVQDEDFLAAYNDYQERYGSRIRESDKKIISIVHELTADSAEKKRLLDIGCSTGNLLVHVKAALGERLDLVGGDLADSSLAICRRNEALRGVSFETLDLLELPQGAFDIVVVNCVLYMMVDHEYNEALTSIAASLRPGGAVVIYDFVHAFPQEIEIIEATASHPNGLRLCFRSQTKVASAFERAGFASWEFQPFVLPIDLPKIEHETEIITYTRKDEHGERMAFRGVLYQPWCHMIARKAP